MKERTAWSLLALLATASAALVPILVLGGCGDGANARYEVRESVEQLHVTRADPSTELAVYDSADRQVQVGTTDAQGSLVFRRLPPGSGYTVRTTQKNPPERSRPLRVLSVAESQPPPDFYRRQRLQPGYGYIQTRDGTTLSVYVTLPGPLSAGPYPTVVNYSGYSPSRPGEPVNGGAFSFLCDSLPVLCDAPNDPSGLIAGLMGYATVSVNIRGTGCSGGAYDFFETLQVLDGYDVIETVAAQDWVLHHKVGMTGLSYPGISQLFVAQAQPPSLAAITPLSVIGNTSTTLRPGGILNNGFAIQWVTSVLNGASPYGQGWEQARVDAGDRTCADNQLLHGQRIDNVAQAAATEYYVPEIIDPLNPTRFVPEIKVPVFLAGAWQDEQTGPFFTTLLDRFSGAPLVRVTVYNGVHPDGFAPQILTEWKAFLDLFVARRIPSIDPLVRTIAPLLASSIFQSNLQLPPDRFGSFASYDQALAAYQAEPSLRVIFESGGDASDLGAPVGTFERTFPSWPPTGQTPLRYYFHADGSLGAGMPTEATAASSFDFDPAAGQRGILASGGNVWDKLPAYDWRAPAAGRAVAFETAPLGEDLVMVGTGSADLWLRSTAADADLEINVTEVRPDGQEMYVQSGWLRASERKLDGAASSDLWPVPTYLEADVQPLVPGEWVSVRVPIAGFGHVFRAGSRIRVSVDTPGDSRAAWRFENKPLSGATHTIGHSATYPSSVALPQLVGTTAPTPLPPCPSLRGQPCRDYVPFTNTPAN
jgi:predicted acyl esterase